MVKININNNETNLVLLNQLELKKPIQTTTAKRKSLCCIISLFISGLTSLIISIIAIRYPIIDIVLHQRLEMTPGLPAYDWWLKPQPEVRLLIYLFTVENPKEFLNGSDRKLKLKEVGPIIYREYLEHKDVVFHDNSTLSYTAERTIKFLPDANEPGILNRTILVPNFAILATAASLHDSLIFTKVGFKILHRTSDDEVFLNTTIYDYLWNYRSDVVRKAKKLVPFMVPTTNTGILTSIYDNFTDRYNVRIGAKYGDDQFFQISTINGATTVPGYSLENGDCDASVVNSTEGALYNQHITKKSVLNYWRKSLCRKAPLYFEKEYLKGKINAYKFILHNDTYDRITNGSADCYKGFNVHLPSGLSDLSKCYFNMPFAASAPHYYGRTEINDRIEGLNPSKEKHGSYAIVEPTMGVSVDQCARSQSNLIVPVLNGFLDDYERFSNMTVPLFWLEYSQHDLTPPITSMIEFTVNTLPLIQIALNGTLILIGVGLMALSIIYIISAQNLLLISEKKKIYIYKTNSCDKVATENDCFINGSKILVADKS